MFVRLNDPSNANYRRDEVRKIIRGIANNLPHLLPIKDVTANDKRRALRAKGLTLPTGKTLADVPMIAIPAAIDGPVTRYARKIAAALYYKEKGRSVGTNYVVSTEWGAATDLNQMKTFKMIAEMSPLVTIGSRRNLDFGDRFGYRCDKADDNDLFMAIAQFGRGVILVMMIADEISFQELEGDDWVRASQLFA